MAREALCLWCLKLFVKTNNQQLYCKEREHEARCLQCSRVFSWRGKPEHLYSSRPHHCSPCRRRLGTQAGLQAQAKWSAEEKAAIVLKRKATMMLRYGGETTLESPHLRARKEATMMKLYGGEHTKSSSRSMVNSAAKRARRQGLPLARSLELSELFASPEKLTSYLHSLRELKGRYLTLADIARELGVDVAEVSHKLAKLPELSKNLVRKRVSNLEELVLDHLKVLGFREQADYRRWRRLPNGLEMDVVLQGRVSIEINDFCYALPR